MSATIAVRSFFADVNRRLSFGITRQSTIGSSSVTHSVIRRRSAVVPSV